MLSKRESQAFFKKRRSYSWIIVCALFIGGLAFIGLAVSLYSNDDDDQPGTSERHIETHASAERNLGKSNASSAQAEAQQATSPSTVAQNDTSKQANTAAKATKKGASAPESKNETGYSHGAKALLQQAPNSGTTAPKVGRFYIIKKPIEYSKNASPEAIAAAKATTYIVVSGDILGRIANKFGCSIEQIQKANRMTNDQIKIGQKLLIPNCSGNEEIVPLVAEPTVDNNAPKPANVQRGKWWKASGVNTTLLPALMKAEGFKPPQKFMGFVIELTFDSTRTYVTKERAFDYAGTSLRTDWNPASAVKTFAAIGALKRIEELGFTSKAKVTFNGKKPYTNTVSALIEAAIIQSDNIAYDRVVQLASFDKLHREILTSKYGISRTALNRAYQLTDWQNMGENPSFRVSPPITITENGKKTVKLPAENSKASVPCSSAACTTLQDLGEFTRRLMLQEQLEPNESFSLAQPDLLMLRRAMRSEDRTRGREMVDIFAKVFGDSRVKFYSKPGFSEDWFTDNVYIFDPRYNQAWIVVMSGYPGRKSLDSAATAIAKIISSGKLRAAK